MLNSVNLNDKTYEELLAEAMAQIPLYSDEWTNFNVSDPGITVLQNLTSFNLLQQTRINEVSDAVRRRLLKLLGYEATECRAARALIEVRSPDAVTLPAHSKLMAGSLCFETQKTVTMRPWGITAVFAYRDNTFKDITYLLDRDVPGAAAVFGAHPERGRAFYCIMDGAPEPGQPLHMYIRVHDEHKRTPFAEQSDLRFAELKWQYFTERGWQDVEVADGTHALLMSGDLRLDPPASPPAIYTGAPVQGYAVRCVVRQAEYDIPPHLHSIAVNLFEAFQRDTRVKTYSFTGKNRIELHSELAAFECEFVYCREDKGQPYRKYELYVGGDENGRYYTKSLLPGGVIALGFSKRRFGFGPYRGRDAVRVVCCDDEIVHHRKLETVYGYENQIIDIDLVTDLVPDDFRLLVETPDGDDKAYEFVRPGRIGPDELCYSVNSGPGEICIGHPGAGDCTLYLADCATTAGADGNIRAGNTLTPRGGGIPRVASFRNISEGMDGRSFESVEQLRKRFVGDMKRASVAVTCADYEDIARATPGLCIHKVRAMESTETGVVKVAIKPYTEDEFPVMSPLYRRQAARHIERRRVITTKVELVQPRYIPVDVYATLHVKSYYENARRSVEAALMDALDGVTTDKPFGAPVRFSEIYRMLERLPCVEAVYDLMLTPRTRTDVAVQGSDIVPAGHCLCHAGRLSLRISTKSGSNV